MSTAKHIFTARKRSLGQGNIFSSVCQEFCPQGGVCLSACLDTPPPQEQRHPPEQTPPGADPPGADPPAQCMLGDTVNKRAVCILLECNLVERYFSRTTFISNKMKIDVKAFMFFISVLLFYLCHIYFVVTFGLVRHSADKVFLSFLQEFLQVMQMRGNIMYHSVIMKKFCLN